MPKRKGSGGKREPQGIIILYEDKDILVVDKPPGLLTVATEREDSRTACWALTDYVRKGCAKSRNRAYVVHRLDRDVSGILLFAKSEKAQTFLKDHWTETRKKYLAVVWGQFEQKAGTFSSFLIENDAYVVSSTSDKTKGKLSHTAYRVLKETKALSLLEIDLLTGRKHQIRVHLAESGHPLVGDTKYGRRDDTHRRLALHAKSIAFTHPFSGKPLSFETLTPPYFARLVGGMTQEGKPA